MSTTQREEEAYLLLFRQQHAGEKGLNCSLQLIIALVRLLGELRSKVSFDMIQALMERREFVVDFGDHATELGRVLQSACLLLANKCGELFACPVDKIGNLRELI